MVRRQTKNNPLRNRHALLQLNPYAKVEKRRATAWQNKRIKAKAKQLAQQAEVSCGIWIIFLYLVCAVVEKVRAPSRGSNLMEQQLVDFFFLYGIVIELLPVM